MRHAVLYKNVWLASNSDAFKLHEAQEWKKLDAHLKEVFARYEAQLK